MKFFITASILLLLAGSVSAAGAATNGAKPKVKPKAMRLKFDYKQNGADWPAKFQGCRG